MRYFFITGVSKGLGLALANRFDAKGNRVIGFSRSQGDYTGEFHTCDLSKPLEASAVLATALNEAELESASEIVFIANAGLLGPLDFLRTLDSSDIAENLTANLVGAAVGLQRFLERVREITVPKLYLQISSGAALPERVKPGWSLYCASKSGQEQLVRTVAAEQASEANPTMLVNLNPGLMETGMQRLIRSTPKEAFPDVDQFIEFKESGRVPSPESVADTIATLVDRFQSLENGASYKITDFQ